MMKSWKEYIYKKKVKAYSLLMALVAITVFLGYKVEFDFVRIFTGIPNMMNLVKRMLTINTSYIMEVSSKLLETIEIAIIASLIGIIIAIPLSILVSKNTAPNKIIWQILNIIFAFFRTIPSLVWAAVLVTVFSIGKFSGILALSITSVLAALKMLKDYIEGIPNNILNSTIAVGASKLQVLKYCILPTIMQQSLAIFFMVLEINIRGATVLGFVGAGGIGQIMWRDLNHLRYDNLATLILILLITIFLIDYISLHIREKLKTTHIRLNNIREFKLYKKLKNIAIIALIGVLIYLVYKSIGIDKERLMLGLSQFKSIITRMINMDFSYMPKMIKGLKESIYIAMLATIIGTVFGLILSYFASYNINSNKYVVMLIKLFVNLLRTFPSIVMAIIFFRGVGPGALAGVLALGVYTTGVFTKLYSEVIENINDNILNSVRVTGCENIAVYKNGVLPETRPNFVALVLYRMESNMRTSTIMGIIGAGGIGASLTTNIAWRNWEVVGLLIFGIAVTVALIDVLSNLIRKKYI